MGPELVKTFGTPKSEMGAVAGLSYQKVALRVSGFLIMQ